MHGIIIGIKWNGERLRFERWLYDAWRCRVVSDSYLLAALESCHTFRENW